MLERLHKPFEITGISRTTDCRAFRHQVLVRQAVEEAVLLNLNHRNTASGLILRRRLILIAEVMFRNLHGRQLEPVDPALGAIPRATIGWKYPSEAMAKAFFVDNVNGVIQQDGYFSFSIKGKQVDFTQGNFAQA